ncbi:MAG: pyruvate kinase [Gammaproteobacteria bacterium]|nr:pyruvate kinase [Gammaproteobacteria bacterium]MBI5615439.1 pyruvate kinase [Gammaproteobacteria bacterium]
MSVLTEFDLLKYRRTKIVATLGPASSGAPAIRALIEAGVDVFRVNMSHGSQDGHAAVIATIRSEARALGRHTAILADLCGPKIRMGRFAGGRVELLAGAEVLVTTRDVPGDATIIPSQYADLAADVRAGDRILLNDGAVELRVETVDGTDVRCRVIAGGPIGDHKGINLPGVAVSAPSLTDKDLRDAEFALAQEVDFIALSFVRTAEDVRTLRRLVDASTRRPGIVAKIEKPEALRNSAAIVDAADAIMVARGDLGVELNPEQVPIAQSQLIALARRYDKPVIVATQMLESMIQNARPTRAEVTDVSHAVASGADAVMLSGETAVGEHAVEAVAMMARIARQTESYEFHAHAAPAFMVRTAAERRDDFGDAIADAVAKLVAEVQVRGVIVISMQGVTAGTISAARPAAPIVAVSPVPETCRRMGLLWGVLPQLDAAAGTENPNVIARRVAAELGLGKSGDFVVLVRGFHAHPALNTPTITLLRI